MEPFTGEGVDTLFEEWLLTFEWMATWNSWSEPEKLLQLAGHLRGKARQEWTLLEANNKLSYDRVTSMLKSKLDPSRKVLAVQDFRHLSQGKNEVVGDFIRRLEQTFVGHMGMIRFVKRLATPLCMVNCTRTLLSSKE